MAEKQKVFVRVNVKVLLIVLLLTVPVVLFDMFWVLDRSRSDLTAMIGEKAETIAANGASQVAGFVESRVRDVKLVTTFDELLSAAERSTRKAQGQSESAQVQRYLELNRTWETPAAAPVIAEVLANQTSIKLRDYLELNPAIERILVTDAQGATVAASHKPIIYYHGDQDWWTRSFGDGRTGSVVVGDVDWDPVSFLKCWAISAPLIDSNREVIGIVRALVSVGEMDPILAALERGRGRADLVGSGGIAVPVRQPSRQGQTESEAMEVIAPLLAEEPSGFVVTELQGGREVFLGFAGVQLSGVVPDFEWAVILTEDTDELSAAVDSINLRALASGFLAILLLGSVAVYFTTHRPEKHAPMEEALHEVEAEEGIRTADGQTNV